MNKQNKFCKSTILVISMIAMITCIVGSTLAFLIDKTDPVKNTFEPSSVSCAVTETLNGNIKSNVKIQNTGDIDAYIRAMVVVTWKDADGNVYGRQPVIGTDYAITYGTGWTEDSGFYYYNNTVAAGASTGDLITKCNLKKKTATRPEGYSLSVEIIADAIQTNAVNYAWGYTPSGN